MAWIKAYKGFGKDMKCRGFQYEEGKTYELPEEQEAKLCESGFHACEYPLDCLNYYNPTESEYHSVDLDASDKKQSDDTKRVGKRIKVGAKLSIKNLVEASIEYINEHIDKNNKKTPRVTSLRTVPRVIGLRTVPRVTSLRTVPRVMGLRTSQPEINQAIKVQKVQ